MEDSIINYIISKISESLFILKKIGYYYLKNGVSMTKNLNKINDLKLKFCFIYLNLVFDYSKNTKYQKDMANSLFNTIKNYINCKFKETNNNYNYFNKVINIYLKCSFITDENKYILNYLKNKIKKKLNIKKII